MQRLITQLFCTNLPIFSLLCIKIIQKKLIVFVQSFDNFLNLKMNNHKLGRPFLRYDTHMKENHTCKFSPKFTRTKTADKCSGLVPTSDWDLGMIMPDQTTTTLLPKFSVLTGCSICAWRYLGHKQIKVTYSNHLNALPVGWTARKFRIVA